MTIRILFLIITFATCFSCVKEQSADPATLYTSPDFFAKLNINGTPLHYQQTISGVIADAKSAYIGVEFFEVSTFSKKEPNAANQSFSISLSKIFYATPSNNQTDSLFSIGYYDNFGQSTANEVSVQIEHIDAAGLRWLSTLGPQTGSQLQILSTELSAGPGFRYKVRGRFTCNLYNSTSVYKQYSGEFVCKFGAGNF